MNIGLSDRCQGDRCLMDFFPSVLMYSHSPERNRVDVVDLDPYGTAAPFIDAAVQCVADGGMPPPTS